MINRVILVGRLTRDPELRKTASGLSVCSFTIAVDRRKSRNSDPSQPTADFINCVAWRQTADFMTQYLSKGRLIGVEGRIQTRNYDDPNQPGRKVYVTEVVCDSVEALDPKRDNNQSTSTYGNSYYPDENPYEEASSSVDTTPTLNISSDDLPF